MPKKIHHWTPEDVQTLRDHYGHEPVTATAHRLGLRITQIRSKAFETGLNRLPKPHIIDRHIPALRRCAEAGMTVREASEATGISINVIRNSVQFLPPDIRFAPGGNGRIGKYRPETLMARMRSECPRDGSLSIPQIAQRFGTNANVAYRYCHLLGIPYKKCFEKHVYTPAESLQLEDMYAAGKSFSEMAAAIGVSERSVICRLRNMGVIPINHRKKKE